MERYLIDSEDAGPTLVRILHAASGVKRNRVKRVILLYDEELKLVGDSCVRFDKMKYFSEFFGNPVVDINFRSKKSEWIYDALLKNNPHVATISNLDWDDIPLLDYDIVFCISYTERLFLEFLHKRYGQDILEGMCGTIFFSISQLMLVEKTGIDYIFPVYEELMRFLKASGPGELYLDEKERCWADWWLENQGVGKTDQLYILIDSSGIQTKLVAEKVFFKILKHILKKRDVKVLVFDENNIGKEKVYRRHLGERLMGKMIFSKGLSLRNNLCLVGSGYTKFIFGPCTGIMHCSSSIYNHYAGSGRSIGKVPPIVVYTGRVGAYNYDVNVWWGNSPLVNCLLLFKRGWRKRLVLLDSLPEAEKKNNGSLRCSAYSARMLIKFIDSRLNGSYDK
jgi:hypothetical protein